MKRITLLMCMVVLASGQSLAFRGGGPGTGSVQVPTTPTTPTPTTPTPTTPTPTTPTPTTPTPSTGETKTAEVAPVDPACCAPTEEVVSEPLKIAEAFIFARTEAGVAASLEDALNTYKVDGLLFTLKAGHAKDPLYRIGGKPDVRDKVLFNPDITSRSFAIKETATSGTSSREIEMNPNSQSSNTVLPEAWQSEAAQLLSIGESNWLKVPRTVTPAQLQAVKTRYASQGDLNGDNIVDLTDLGILASNYGKTSYGLKGDLNNDGTVDAADVAQFKEFYPL